MNHILRYRRSYTRLWEGVNTIENDDELSGRLEDKYGEEVELYQIEEERDSFQMKIQVLTMV